MGWREILDINSTNTNLTQITQNTQNTHKQDNSAYSASSAYNNSNLTSEKIFEDNTKQLTNNEINLCLKNTKETYTRYLGRRHVFSIIMRRFAEANNIISFEDLPDYIIEELMNIAIRENGYDLEKAISEYASLAPPPPEPIDTRCKCGYVPPFCGCSFGLKAGY